MKSISILKNHFDGYNLTSLGYFDLTATQAAPKIVQKRFLDYLEQKKKF